MRGWFKRFVHRLRRSVPDIGLPQVLAAFGLLYLVVFTAMAWRRWGCQTGWSHECWTTFASRAESAVLFLWVRDWDTFGGAIATLLAAIVGASALYFDAKSKRRAQLHAERSVLALSLVDLNRYAVECIAFLNMILHDAPIDDSKTFQTIPTTDVSETPPNIPAGLIDSLRSVTSLASRAEARLLADLLSRIQVQNSRMTSLLTDLPDHAQSVSRNQLLQRVAEAVALHAAGDELFAWARRRPGGLSDPIGRSKAENSLSVLRINSGRADDVGIAKRVRLEMDLPPPAP